MSQRAGMSQVKFRVRHNALLLRAFTAADMIRATGLNPESVRTELQRMKQEGLLVSRTNPGNPKKRGGPPALYKLTEDQEGRAALSESIEAFYPPPPLADKPTSRHYLLAQQLLNRAQIAEGERRMQLLAQAEQDLELAEQAEGGTLAPKPIEAYLQYERARLAYLRGEIEEAKRGFEELRELFADAQNDKMLGRLDEFRLCLKVREQFVGQPSTARIQAARALSLLQTLADHAYQTDSPLILLSLEILRDLRQTVDRLIEMRQHEVGEEIIESPQPGWAVPNILGDWLGAKYVESKLPEIFIPPAWELRQAVEGLEKNLRAEGDYTSALLAASDRQAVEGLEKNLRSVELLSAALQNPESEVRKQAVATLGQLGVRAIEPLIAALRDTDSEVRQQAAEALSQIGDVRAVEPLIAALQHSESEVRKAVVAFDQIDAVPEITADALEALYDRHAATVYNLIHRIVRDPAIAEDILQETFSTVWQKAGEFSGQGSVAGWIFGIARNKSLDQLRRQKARPQSVASASEEIEGNLNDQRLLTALAQIPAEQRHYLELAYFDGLTPKQIAEYTQTPLGAVRIRLRTGLQKLQRILRAVG